MKPGHGITDKCNVGGFPRHKWSGASEKQSIAALQRIKTMSSMAPDGSSPQKNRIEPYRCQQGASTRTSCRWQLKPGGSDRLPRRVLLVEPSPSESARLRNELIAGRIEVYIAGDLITAIHALSLYQPSLILAQLRLPTFSGLELIRRLKEDHATAINPHHPLQ